MRSRPVARWLIGVLIVSSVILLRWFAADQLSFGPEDVAVFADRSYGLDVDEGTPPFFLTWIRGDGQAFYTIASDLDADEQAANLGNPSYRLSRIGLSLLARLLTLGNTAWLTYTLPLVSLLSYGALVLISIRLTDRLGSRALLLPLTPAAIVAAMYDTAEALGTALLVASLTAGTLAASSGYAALLALTRPSYAIGLPASQRGLLPSVAALGAGGAFQLFLIFGLGTSFSGGAGNIGFPLVGLIQEWPSMGMPGRLVAVVVVGAAIALVTLALSHEYSVGFRAAAILTAVFSLSLASPVYSETFSPLRGTAPALVLIILAPLLRAPGKSHRASQ